MQLILANKKLSIQGRCSAPSRPPQLRLYAHGESQNQRRTHPPILLPSKSPKLCPGSGKYEHSEEEKKRQNDTTTAAAYMATPWCATRSGATILESTLPLLVVLTNGRLKLLVRFNPAPGACAASGRLGAVVLSQLYKLLAFDCDLDREPPALLVLPASST
jgi:hypothetical protein